MTEAGAELKRRMSEHPDDVETILLAARLAIAEDRSSPRVISRGAESPTAESIKNEPRAVHALLDRVLVLAPDNAEAHYWKARVYGTEDGIVRDGRFYRVPRDQARAIQLARRAVELAPAQPSYREALALYLVADGKLEEASAAVREVPGLPHPIPRLLADIATLPLPKGSVLLAEDSAAFREQQLERHRIADYPQLRVFFYVVPQSAADIEASFRTRWPDFHLFPIGEDEVEAGAHTRILGEILEWDAETLRPVVSEAEFHRIGEGDAVTSVSLSVVELRNPPAARRERSLGGARLPADLGNVFCYLVLVNGRRIAAP